MSSEEEKRILRMVEDGKISADEAMKLINALEKPPIEDEPMVIAPVADEQTWGSDKIDFDEVKARARRYAMVPLSFGIGLIVLSAYWMFALIQNSNYGFWFFCALIPLLLGVLTVLLSSSGTNTHWLYVDVHQNTGEWPQRITLGFPLPIGIASWGLRNFGHHISNLTQTDIDSLLYAFETSNSITEPIIVNVDEGNGGERVRVYIG